jgi:hypothetical protein
MNSVTAGFVAVMLAGIVLADSAPPKVGDAAPDFSLPYATRDSIASDDLKLSSLVGKRNIVLAFYPADWSGGCTKEVCTLRDNFTALSALNAEIIGLSGLRVCLQWGHTTTCRPLASDRVVECEALRQLRRGSGH